MPGLREVIESLAPDGDGWRIEAPAGWSQGRTLYGGITSALAFEAAKVAMPDLPPLRSAQLAFIGPASGLLSFRPALLRQGRSATYVSVDCSSEAGLAARALFALGADRPSQISHDIPLAPAVPPPDECEPFFATGRGPASFFNNFDMRLAAGARPFTPGAPPWFSLWVRHLDAVGVDPVTALLALADSPPPAAMVSFPEFAPISTMTWTIDITQPLAAGDWRLLRSASEQAAAGYSQQAMALWDDAGRRLAVASQTVAVFT